MYPEQWLLPIDQHAGRRRGAVVRARPAQLGEELRLLGQQHAARRSPTSGRAYDVDLGTLGLARDRRLSGARVLVRNIPGRRARARSSYTVPAHGHAVIALREATGHPQFLGDNRHFTQGAHGSGGGAWEAETRTLHLVFDVDQGAADAVPFEYRFRIFVPDGFRLANAAVGAGVVAQTGQVLTVTLTPASRQRVTLALAFD